MKIVGVIKVKVVLSYIVRSNMSAKMYKLPLTSLTRSISFITNRDIFTDEVGSARTDFPVEDSQILPESHFLVGDAIKTYSVFRVREQWLQEEMTITEKTCREGQGIMVSYC